MAMHQKALLPTKASNEGLRIQDNYYSHKYDRCKKLVNIARNCKWEKFMIVLSNFAT